MSAWPSATSIVIPFSAITTLCSDKPDFIARSAFALICRHSPCTGKTFLGLTTS